MLSHNTLSASRLDSLSDTTLFATCNGRSTSLPIDSIAILVHTQQGHFIDGAKVGALVGAGIGVVIGALSYQKPVQNGFTDLSDAGPFPDAFGGGFLGAGCGFLIGGLISSSDHEETYVLWTEKTLTMKRQILQQAF